LEPALVSIPVRGSVVASVMPITCVAPRLETVIMRELPANSTVTFFEEIPGLPVGAAAVRRTVAANQFGQALAVRIGRGRMWMLTGSTSRLRLMERVQISGLDVCRPTGGLVQYRDRFRQLQGVLGTEIKLVSSNRHQNVQTAVIENIAQLQVLRVRDSFDHSVAHAEVFAISQSACLGQPDVRFLGFTLENGALSIGAVGMHEDVFVIGPDGEVAWESRPGSLVVEFGQPLELQLQATGRVMLDESLQPAAMDPDRVVKITFRRSSYEMLDGMVPEAVRFATDNQWEVRDLAPGSYEAEIRGATYAVVVPSTGFVLLTAN